MEANRNQQVKQIVAAAIELPADARDAFTARECGDDAKLLAAVREMIDAMESAERRGFLTAAPNDERRDRVAIATSYISNAEIGATIGRYKLLEPIGEGGMGAVWMAEQRVPIKRLVALKLIKPGMDSRAVLTRFEAERQALAMMDHPNIARVLDGGTTDTGRPYFVMELVKGLPLTEYCDQRKMNVHDRLELFMQICSAVQHAHTKGVIHRDLKPSNVLITEHDGKPVPKVIDFGLAKALGGTSVLTEHTLHTAFGAVAGTPMYMAPEQVAINALDVDTRADIYALGVILYELLTGTTPLEAQRFKEAAWDEMKRVIREEEPPRPSLRISRSATLANLAATRDVEPAKLSGLVKGDLDWIVLKALEKDRNRRYETANGLSADIARHLSDEPVQAVPASLTYRTRKFIRKNKASAAVAALVSVMLIVGTLVSNYFRVRAQVAARREQQRADAAERQKLIVTDTLAELVRPGASITNFAEADTAGYLAGFRQSATYERIAPEDRPVAEVATLARVLMKGYVEQINAAELEAYIANIALAQAAINSDNWPEARTRLDACPEAKRGWEWRFMRQKAGNISKTLAPAGYASFLRDGSAILVRDAENVTVYKTDGQQYFSTIRATEWVQAADVRTFEGRAPLALTLTAADVQVWDTQGKQVGKSIVAGERHSILAAAFADDGAISTIDRNCTLKRWSLAGEEIGKPLTVCEDGRVVDSAQFSQGARILLLGIRRAGADAGETEFALTWDMHAGKMIGQTRAASSTHSLHFAAGDQRVISIHADQSVRVRSLDGQLLCELPSAPGDGIVCAVLNADGNEIATGYWNGIVRRWSLDGRPRGSAIRCGSDLRSLNYTPSGEILTSSTGEAALWNAGGACVARFSSLIDVNMSTINNENLVLLDTEESMESGPVMITRLDDLDSNASSLGTTAADQSLIDSLINKRDARLVEKPEVAAESRTTAVMKADDPQILAHLHYDRAGSSKFGISPDGARVVSCVGDSVVRLHDTKTAREVAAIPVAKAVSNVCFTRDGGRILVQFDDKTAELWDGRPYADRQKDRDAIFAEHVAADSIVEQLLTTSKKEGELIAEIRDDHAALLPRRIAGLEALEFKLTRIDYAAGREFQRLQRECISPTLVRDEATKATPSRMRDVLIAKIDAWKPTRDELLSAAWEVVRKPDEPRARYAAAISVISNGAKINAGEFESKITLAWLYRSDMFEDVVKVTGDAAMITAETPELLAFRAMSQFKLGNKFAARSTLQRLEQRIMPYPKDHPPDCLDLYEEAGALIGGPSTRSSTQPTTEP